MSKGLPRRVLCVGPRRDQAAVTAELGESVQIVFTPNCAGVMDALRQGSLFDIIAIDAYLTENDKTCLEEILRDGRAPMPVLLLPHDCTPETSDAATGINAVTEPLPVPAAEHAPNAAAAPPSSRRVLVVDDDASTLKLIARLLHNAGYEVLTAENGNEALRILRDQSVQIVVSDWMMPGMSGLELCKAVRSDETIGFVFFVMVTAQHDRNRVMEAFDAGADDYLTKPFDRGELLVRMRAGSRIVELEAGLMHRTREIHKANANMAILNEKLKRLATTDELTGLFNRRQTMAKFTSTWAMAERYGQPLTCLILDIDHFKAVNDTHGHAAGDVILKATSDTLTAAARTTDTVGRIGGEEFVIVAPNTDADDAVILAERIRKSVENAVVSHQGKDLQITVSIGIASKSDATPDPEALLTKADEALYKAKGAGRNCYRTAQPQPAEA